MKSSASTTSWTPSGTKRSQADPDKVKLLEQAPQSRHREGQLLRRCPTSTRASSRKTAASGMNAGTGEDSTELLLQPPRQPRRALVLSGIRPLPASRLPRFYKERDVVREERRMRTESDPQGKLLEMLRPTAHRGASLPQSACRLGQRHRKPPREGRRGVLQ